jgi:putative SOS response-associated peptidase YedK
VSNDFGNSIPYSAYLEAFRRIRAPVVFPTAAPNLEPRDDIWPTEIAPVFRRRDEGVEMVQLRWGFLPARPKGAPIINFRSEGRRFPKGRCLIPASHFFEFTGRKSPKTKWKFTKTGEDWFCFAGLWRPMPESGEAFTILTTVPGPDVALIHNRQVVVLERSDWLVISSVLNRSCFAAPRRQPDRRAGAIEAGRSSVSIEPRGAIEIAASTVGLGSTYCLKEPPRRSKGSRNC